jgi:hypothetical protein
MEAAVLFMLGRISARSCRGRNRLACCLRSRDAVLRILFLLQFGDEPFEFFNPSAHLLHLLFTLVR